MTDEPRYGERPIPADPLAGRSGCMADLLVELSDDEVIDHVRHWEAKRARYLACGEGYSGWWCAKVISGGMEEVRRRGITSDKIKG